MSESALMLGLAGLLGLMVGSFLNVVVHRLPLMLEAQWRSCTETQAPASKALQPFNLAVPRSHCPKCQHRLTWHENLPVLSFVILRARCAHCKTPISWRYPAIELLTAVFFVWAFARYGWGFQALAWAGFASALIALAAIDADTRLLPDAITQPLVWAGLLAASWGLTGLALTDALGGAVMGYLFLWLVFWVFKILTGKDGMGQGDFKLLAALGAWLGWPALLSLVLIASLTGLAGGLLLKLCNQLPENGQMAFGPFLVLAGLTVMLFEPKSLLLF
jgi:leader peptidase (prepilin peptidase) / N-methyltransferase